MTEFSNNDLKYSSIWFFLLWWSLYLGNPKDGLVIKGWVYFHSFHAVHPCHSPYFGFGTLVWASQVAQVVENLPTSAGAAEDTGSIPGLGRPPGGEHGNPLQYSCLENPHGESSLAGYSPRGCKEWNTTEGLSVSLSLSSVASESQIGCLSSKKRKQRKKTHSSHIISYMKVKEWRTGQWLVLFFHHGGKVVLGCPQEIYIMSDWPEWRHISTSSWKENWKYSEIKGWGDFKTLLSNIQPLEVKHKHGKGQAWAWLNLKSVRWTMNSYIFFLAWNIFEDEMKPCVYVCMYVHTHGCYGDRMDALEWGIKGRTNEMITVDRISLRTFECQLEEFLL